MVTRRFLSFAVAAAFAFGACTGSAASSAPSAADSTVILGPSPLPSEAAAAPGTPCALKYNALRCQVVTDLAASNLGLTRDEIVGLDILPDPTLPPGTIRSGGVSLALSVSLRDGSTRTTSIGCGGVAADWNPGCQNDPHVTVRSIISGYGDFPTGSSPIPTIAPDALADAQALRIGRLDIPIDHTGRYEVRLGEARLPNGILTATDFALVERWPAHVTIIDPQGVMLEIRSLEPDGKPFQNVYTHGWRPGVERVEAVLIFDVFHFDPDAKLAIRDVVVR